MKSIFILFIACIASFSLQAQDITGQWNGELNVQQTQLRIVFHVSKTDTGYTATMDSPDQGAKDITVTNTVFEHPYITFEVSNLVLKYTGELKDGEIIGIFNQGGFEIPMNLTRNTIEKAAMNRPQEPKQPYPYDVEEVSFQNSDAKITLAGTLTLPKDNRDIPVVILISGSGPQNRNEEHMGHKPFLVISDYLTRNGIGVLRYDDRGVGQSKGDFATATSADLATDVESAIAYLKTRKEINPNKIGLLGHSEGGLISYMVAAKTTDVNFIVSLAGPGLSGYDIILLQTELINKANGKNPAELEKELAFLKQSLDMVVAGTNLDEVKIQLTDTLRQQLTNSPKLLPEGMTTETVNQFVETLTTPWLQYFLTFDPGSSLAAVSCPVLALFGEKDLQVPPKENLSAIKNALSKGGNKNVIIKEIPNLNHLFQEAETGSPTEYGTIEQTFSPVVLEEITTWIKRQME